MLKGERMATEFNLSDKINDYGYKLIDAEDVKEFIKRLKEDLRRKIHYTFMPDIIMIIDKRAGDKLK